MSERTELPVQLQSDIQDATLLLLVRVNKLLEEADAVRVLRDRLIALSQQHSRPPDAPTPS